MEKNKLERFIDKYSLGGNIEAAKWICSNNNLSTITASDDKNIVVDISTESISLSDGEYNIFQTALLRKMLTVLDKDITFKTKNEKDGTAFLLSDAKNKLRFALADPSVIPNIKRKLLPEFDFRLDIDLNITNSFIKAYTAIEEDTFTIKTENLIPQIVFGYDTKRSNTNMISIELSNNKVSSEINPMKFNAQYLKSAFSINKEFTTATLEWSEVGLLKISFVDEDFISTYYLSQVIK